jgi:hypothetical protein
MSPGINIASERKVKKLKTAKNKEMMTPSVFS